MTWFGFRWGTRRCIVHQVILAGLSLEEDPTNMEVEGECDLGHLQLRHAAIQKSFRRADRSSLLGTPQDLRGR